MQRNYTYISLLTLFVAVQVYKFSWFQTQFFLLKFYANNLVNIKKVRKSYFEEQKKLNIS